ncbi:MAG: DNA topoisomerase IB [Solirubrobacteraceae bacterium]
MVRAVRRPRLRRSDCSGPGLRRVRRGRGFSYEDEDGIRVPDPEVLARISELTIPPAWKEVWICSDPLGHLQATGIDAAGRKQYLYHERWREQRDRAKFRRMTDFGRALPRMRRGIEADLEDAGPEPTRTRVLACAVRLLDIGLFRIGNEEYAEDDGGLGLTTVRREHVTLKDGAMLFDYPAKSGVRRVHEIRDHRCYELVARMKRRHGGAGPQLLAYRDRRQWHAIRSDEVNAYLKQQIGDGFSAKDFRTWNATVLAAVGLASGGQQAMTRNARKATINRAVKAVSELLGNTPAVARRAYIDPRVFDRYLSGWTISGALDRLGELEHVAEPERRRIEAAVLDLLEDDHESPALSRIVAA